MTDHANWSARGRAPAGGEASIRAYLAADRASARRDAALALVDEAASGLEPATVSALVDRVRRDEDPAVRQFAVEALGAADSGLSAVRQALADPEAWVRAEAVVAYSRAGEDVEELRTMLDDPDGWVRRNALVALGKAEAVDAATLRGRLRDDSHPGIREYAAAFLSGTPGDVAETVRVLAAVLARDPDAFVRAKAAASLGDLGTARAIEAIETQGLNDRSDDVRRTAERALATARGEDPDRHGAARRGRSEHRPVRRPAGPDSRPPSRSPPPGGGD